MTLGVLNKLETKKTKDANSKMLPGKNPKPHRMTSNLLLGKIRHKVPQTEEIPANRISQKTNHRSLSKSSIHLLQTNSVEDVDMTPQTEQDAGSYEPKKE